MSPCSNVIHNECAFSVLLFFFCRAQSAHNITGPADEHSRNFFTLPFPELQWSDPRVIFVERHVTAGSYNATFVRSKKQHYHLVCEEAKSYNRTMIFMPYQGEDLNQTINLLRTRLSNVADGASVGIFLSMDDYCNRLPEGIKPLLLDTTRYEVKFIMCRYGLPYGFEVTPPTVDKLPPVFQVPIGQNIADVIQKHASSALEPAHAKRKYTCSFIGNPRKSIIPRAKAVSLVEANPQWNCFLDTSRRWVTENIGNNASLRDVATQNFVNTTLNSDFALCPAGNNVESYRIYESVELGSIPILTRRETRASMKIRSYQCTTTYPFLQEFNAPFVWLDSWDELPQVMEALLQETPEQIYQRRCDLIVLIDVLLCVTRVADQGCGCEVVCTLQAGDASAVCANAAAAAIRASFHLNKPPSTYELAIYQKAHNAIILNR